MVSPTALCLVWCVVVYAQAPLTLFRHLLHDLGFSDSRRPHQKNRSLSDLWNHIIPELIFGKICSMESLISFFARFISIYFFPPYNSPVTYRSCPSSRMILIAHGGTSTSSYSSSMNTNAVS